MGKWNSRWVPRNNNNNNNNKYRSYDLSSNYYSHDELLSPEDWNSNVPAWEKQFCLTVGSVPWKKVLVSKKYMHCHDKVVRWDDSANEEAFKNAKDRFRLDMDGLPCDHIPLPDPNMCIDEIDWNPDIDPKLIADLDEEYFNPDEGQYIKKVETVSRSYNPWEGKAVEASRDVAQGGNEWNDFIGEENDKRRNNSTTENPWERSNDSVKGGVVNDTTWLNSSDKSWGWKQKEQLHDDRLWSSNFSGQCGRQNVGSAKDEGWCSSRNNYKGQNQVTNDKDWGWRQQSGHQTIDKQNVDSSRGGEFSDVGNWRKREGSHQYSSRHKIPRFHVDDRVEDRYWSNGNSQNRVSYS